MASVIKIGKRWRAQVRQTGHKRQTKTFPTKAQATQWARLIEGKQAGAPIDDVEQSKLSVAQFIQAYRNYRDESAYPISDTSNEHYMLNKLAEHLGHHRAAQLSAHDLVQFCKTRRAEGAGPYTINMDISKLGTLYRRAPAVIRGLRLPDVVAEARPMLADGKHIGGGNKRYRRPTEHELECICARVPNYLAEIVRFAIASCMRRGEIVRLRWSDIDHAKRCIWIRDRKAPKKKIGNDQLVPLLGEAWDIVQRQPREHERIFPYHEQTISKTFREVGCTIDVIDAKTGKRTRTRAIVDLHFHDLRHEGVSRLYEQGYSTPEVQLVSGHTTSVHLQRYTNLRPESLHRGPITQQVQRANLSLVHGGK